MADTTFDIGVNGAQVHHSRVPRTVSVLRLRQRRGECLLHAFRSRALDRPKWEWRVRVQSLDIRFFFGGCEYTVVLLPDLCMRVGH